MIKGDTPIEAIDKVIIHFNVKETTAKRYIRYAKKIYKISVMVESKEPIKQEEIKTTEHPELLSPTLPLFRKYRYRKRMSGRKYFTHFYRFKCLVSETIIIHNYAYTTFDSRPNLHTVLEKHANSFSNHIVSEAKYLESLRPDRE